MKIGVLTYWWSEDNYGQILQCYALQKYLRDMGHDAYLIRYDPRKDYRPLPFLKKLLKLSNPVRLVLYIYRLIQERRMALENKRFSRFFSDFKKDHIVQSPLLYTSYEQLQKQPPEADIYIVGSDQVWNFYGKAVTECGARINAFFLNFGQSTVKRIAYAASWGASVLSDDFITEISPLLQRFNFVSVRERSGIDICAQCGVNDVCIMPDPVFLLPAEHYRKLYTVASVSSMNKRYVLLYMLNNLCELSLPAVYQWAAERQLAVEYVTGNGVIDSYAKNFASIPEWLSLVDNAEYIITNSFHCCVFSVIFDKRFAVAPLIKKFSPMNTRLSDLFTRLQISPRFILNDDFSVLEKPYSVDMSNFERPVFSNFFNG